MTKGSGKPNKEFVGQVTKAQVVEIAKKKLPDTNATKVSHFMCCGLAHSLNHVLLFCQLAGSIA